MGIKLTIETPEFERLAEELKRQFDEAARTKIIAGAIRKALPTVVQRLKALTPVGPTGNLKRAVGSKVVEYPRDGNAVGIVGYQRAGTQRSQSAAGGTVRVGPDRAFHQWWLETGTKQRLIDTPTPPRPYTRKAHTRTTRSGTTTQVQSHTVKGQGDNVYFASSFRRLGPFRIERVSGRQGRVQTDPAYPKAFFRKSNRPITIPQMPAGGSTGRPPLSTAYDETRSTVTEIIQRELALEIGRALTALQGLTS